MAFTHAKTSNRSVSQSLVFTLVFLPAVIAVIIMLVGSNVARAFSLAGAFSLVRFRSEPGDPKDIAYVCLVMAIGLSCGMGYMGYAALFTVLLCTVIAGYSFVEARRCPTLRYLRVTIPETLNYPGAFDEVLARYTARHTLTRVRTADLGSLFRLDYTVVLKNPAEEKDFIDALRCRNGNLEISVLLAAD